MKKLIFFIFLLYNYIYADITLTKDKFDGLLSKEIAIVTAIISKIEDKGVKPTTIEELKSNNYLPADFESSNLVDENNITFVVTNKTIKIFTNIVTSKLDKSEIDYYLNNIKNSIYVKYSSINETTLTTSYYLEKKTINILNTNQNNIKIGNEEPISTQGDIWFDSNIKEFDIKKKIGSSWSDTTSSNKNLKEDGTFINPKALPITAVIKNFTNVDITEEQKAIECRTVGATYNQVLNRCEAFTSDACDGNLFDSTTGLCSKKENSSCSYLGSDWSWNGTTCTKKPFIYNATAVSCTISSYMWHSIKGSNYSKPYIDIPPYYPTFTQEEHNNIKDEYINTIKNNPNNLVGSWFPIEYHMLLDVKDFTFNASTSSGPSSEGYKWFSKTFSQPLGWFPADWSYANKYVPMGIIPSIHYGNVTIVAGYVKGSYFQATTTPPLKENEWKDIANNYDKKYIFKNTYPTHYEMTGKVKKLDFQVNKDCSLRAIQYPNIVTIYGNMSYTGIIHLVSNTESIFSCPEGGTLNQKTCTRIDTAPPKCDNGYLPDNQGKCVSSPTCNNRKMSVSPYSSTPYYGNNGICYSDVGLYCKTYATSTNKILLPNGKQIICWDNSQTCNDTRFNLTYDYSGIADKCNKYNYSCNDKSRYGLAEHPTLNNPTDLFNRLGDNNSKNEKVLPFLTQIANKQNIILNDNFGAMCIENKKSSYTSPSTTYIIDSKHKSGF